MASDRINQPPQNYAMSYTTAELTHEAEKRHPYEEIPLHTKTKLQPQGQPLVHIII